MINVVTIILDQVVTLMHANEGYLIHDSLYLQLNRSAKVLHQQLANYSDVKYMSEVFTRG